MGVRFDQAGQHSHIRQINNLRARGNLRRGSIADTLNLVAANHNHLIVLRSVGAGVNQRTSANHGDLRRCSRAVRLADRGYREQQDNDATEGILQDRSLRG